jgi:signal transduction histidine kinase
MLNNAQSNIDSYRKYLNPIKRASKNELNLQTLEARKSPMIKGILEAVEDLLFVLNSHRQVLLANDKAIKTISLRKEAEAVGKRPGELFECIHANEGPGGCGGSKACLDCGALQAVISARRNQQPETRECLLTIHRKDEIRAAEFRVRATPFQIGQNEFTTVILHDISAEKRREVLEKIFFHDVMNTVGGLKGWSETIMMKGESTTENAAQRIVALSDILTREILHQKMLLEAERGDLVPRFSTCRISDVYEVIKNVLYENSLSKNKTLKFLSKEDAQMISTDLSLLGRVMVNLVINAFEATSNGGVIKVWHSIYDRCIIFHVWNASAINNNVARHIFQRSFSTKAKKGRGIGTYCTKLLVENYLKGQVTFQSNSKKGTTFQVKLFNSHRVEP